MSAFGNYLAPKVIGATMLGSSYTMPSSLWVALATSVTTDGLSVSEVTTNIGYVRQWCRGATNRFSEPTSDPVWTSVLSATLTWSPATTPWGVVAHWTVVDTDTIGQGNVHYHAALDDTRNMQTSDIAEFLAGSLKIQFL